MDTQPLERKILVAVDGSPHSRHTLHYLALLFARQPTVHFQLFSLVGGVNLPPGGEWLEESERLNMLSPRSRQKLTTHQGYLRQAHEFLVKQGVTPERLHSEARICGGGIGEEIFREGRRGNYDAVVLGRRGMTKLEEVLLGSVSQTIFDKCHEIPLWVIDGEINSQRFLVPVDNTPCSLLAVDHLAFMLRDHPQAEITLFHSTALLAARPRPQPEEFHRHWEPEWCREHLQRPDALFQAPRQILREHGFAEERVGELETAKGFEPSRQILRQALMDGYGTIVIGRRGPETRKGVFRGVSDRVLLMAEQVAVWVVG
ncbi:MAG: universal stress protein [Desulfurivibrio sp.]|nr:universal stress protein [Desulfurivibrio sp.]